MLSRVFQNSYFADRQNGQFFKKFAKPLEEGVKCFKNKGKRLIYKKCTKFRMNFVQKSWKTVDFTTKNIQKLIFRGASRPQNAYLAEFPPKKLIISPPPHWRILKNIHPWWQPENFIVLVLDIFQIEKLCHKICW